MRTLIILWTYNENKKVKNLHLAAVKKDFIPQERDDIDWSLFGFNRIFFSGKKKVEFFLYYNQK